jgi:hypothetical protein
VRCPLAIQETGTESRKGEGSSVADPFIGVLYKLLGGVVNLIGGRWLRSRGEVRDRQRRLVRPPGRF